MIRPPFSFYLHGYNFTEVNSAFQALPTVNSERPLFLYAFSLPLDLQQLHGFCQYELAVDALLHKVGHHAVPCEKLLEFLQRARAAITDIVVGIVAESECDLPCRSCRHIC